MFRNTKHQRRFRPTIETLEARRLMSVYADFNGDGFDDLAIGVPLEDVGSVSAAGAVHVLYGTSSGLSLTGTQLWTQDSKFIVDDSEVGDKFGSALASGDFNNDGFADLAIGVPGEDIGAIDNVGAVQILYGASSGLTTTGNQIFHQDSPRVREINESGDGWGSRLASGDFNGNGFADLVIGAPEEDVGATVDAGAISVLYGGAIGITPVGNQNIHLDTGPMSGTAEDGDHFGRSLAAGDFNNDGRDDIAVGIPFKDIDGVVELDEGAVSVIYGSFSGLNAAINQFWHQGVVGVSSLPFNGEYFGFALAAGDFNNDGRSDLAIGVPGEDSTLMASAGAVHVLYGTNGGIAVANEQFLNQNDAGGNVNLFDEFGSTLVAADFNGDGRSDLAIGVPDETVGLFGPEKAGVVNIVYGSASGITSTGAFELTQETLGTGAQSEENDQFGEVLSAGDFNGNGRADLVIGAPFEDLGASVDAGHVWTLYGAVTGFGFVHSWSQDTAGMPDVSEAGDRFGGGLDASGGKSAPGGGHERHDISRLVTADFEAEDLLTKTTKRRLRR